MRIESIRERLDYDAMTGVFHWKSGRQAGCKKREGYIVIRLDDVLEYAHRMAWAYVHGEWPSGVIDHINGRRSDNRIANLRDVSWAVNVQNQRNIIKPSNASGYKGVQRNHSGWQAVISHAGKRRCLGTFRTPEEAQAVYLAEKRALHVGFLL